MNLLRLLSIVGKLLKYSGGNRVFAARTDFNEFNKKKNIINNEFFKL